METEQTIAPLATWLAWDQKDALFQRGERQDRFRKERRTAYARTVQLFDTVKALEAVVPNALPGDVVRELQNAVLTINLENINVTGQDEATIYSNSQVDRIRERLGELGEHVIAAMKEQVRKGNPDVNQELRILILEAEVNALKRHLL